MYSRQNIKTVLLHYPIGGYKQCLERDDTLEYKDILAIIKRFGVKFITISEIAKAVGTDVCQSSIHERLSRGWSLWEAVSTPSKIAQFSYDEIRILANCYPVGGPKLCIDRGARKNKFAIKYKAHRLGLHYISLRSIIDDFEKEIGPIACESIILNRLKEGWSLWDALTKVPLSKKTPRVKQFIRKHAMIGAGLTNPESKMFGNKRLKHYEIRIEAK